MSDGLPTYNLGNLHKLLVAAFSAEDLRRFCRDRPTFRPIVDLFAVPSSLAAMADVVVEYCEKRGLFGDLLSEVREENRYQWEQWGPYLSAAVAKAGKSAAVVEYEERQNELEDSKRVFDQEFYKKAPHYFLGANLREILGERSVALLLAKSRISEGEKAFREVGGKVTPWVEPEYWREPQDWRWLTVLSLREWPRE